MLKYLNDTPNVLNDKYLRNFVTDYISRGVYTNDNNKKEKRKSISNWLPV